MVTTVDTWDLAPEFPVEQMPAALDAVTSPAQGTLQHQDFQTSASVNTGEAETLAWVLRWKYANLTDWDRLVSMWETSARGALAISYTPPGGSALPVYIAEAPTMRYTGPRNGIEMSVKLVEATNQ